MAKNLRVQYLKHLEGYWGLHPQTPATRKNDRVVGTGPLAGELPPLTVHY
jgi:hypothetical protein